MRELWRIIASLYQQHSPIPELGEAIGNHTTCRPGTNNHKIETLPVCNRKGKVFFFSFFEGFTRAVKYLMRI